MRSVNITCSFAADLATKTECGCRRWLYIYTYDVLPRPRHPVPSSLRFLLRIYVIHMPSTPGFFVELKQYLYGLSGHAVRVGWEFKISVYFICIGMASV